MSPSQRAEEPVVLGVDFGGTKTAAAVVDLSGLPLASATVDSRLAGESAQESFERALQVALNLVESATGASGSEAMDRLLAVGACTFGIPFDDRVELAPTIPGWSEIAFGDGLRRAFPGVEVRVATDVKAAAAAEVRDGALAGYDPALYLNLGTGLAAAVVVRGEVVTGRNGAAGEMAYNLRRPDDVWRHPRERLALEERVSGNGLGRVASSVAGRPVDAADVFAMAETDPAMAELLDEFVAELGFHVANLAIAVDPARVAVGGGLVRSWDRIERGLRRALDAVPFPPELVLARFPHDAALRGVLAMATEAATMFRPDAPPLSTVGPARRIREVGPHGRDD
jgi:glucokinase